MDLIRLRLLAAVPLALRLATAAAAADPPVAEDDPWREVLQARVSAAGEVAYRDLGAFDRARLDRFLSSLASADAEPPGGDERTAFWINAHNAIVVFGIVRGADPATLTGRARLYHWLSVPIGGRPLTPDDIQALLAPHAAADPRIHFALSDGTRSGPPLADEPYVGERLDAQLAAATRRYLFDRRWNRIDVVGREAELSPLFDWHRADFERAGGSILGYASDFFDDPKIASILRRPEMRLRFREYDWRLNSIAGEDLP